MMLSVTTSVPELLLLIPPIESPVFPDTVLRVTVTVPLKLLLMPTAKAARGIPRHNASDYGHRATRVVIESASEAVCAVVRHGAVGDEHRAVSVVRDPTTEAASPVIPHDTSINGRRAGAVVPYAAAETNDVPIRDRDPKDAQADRTLDVDYSVK